MGPILVTGGTATLGRPLVRQLRDAGHEVRVFSRRSRPEGEVGWAAGDLVTGRGVDEAVAGVEAIVHCASDPKRPRDDREAGRNLIAAAASAGSSHLVYISIVGVDRIPFGYYKAKWEVERLVEGSGLPWTILRATQFHDLVLSLLESVARLPVMPLPAATSVQPVEAAEVAAHLAVLAGGGAQGRVPEMGGPEVRDVGDLARAYLRARGRRRPLLRVPIPGSMAAALRRGALLAPDHATGRRTWEEFLAAKRWQE
ncbi:MAG: SDR family oxidoreductase [Candidatus Dormibacteraeota bacterium]|nr:SDR family oxidoreductase [Candidatus Dormibacteraeota bacterium]